MARTTLSDSHWERLCEAIARCDAYKTENLRTAIEGILWRHRTGAPWRDLPAEFGPWKTIYNRFNEWSKNGVWATLFDCIKGNHDSDNEWNFMDGSYVKAHQHAEVLRLLLFRWHLGALGDVQNDATCGPKGLITKMWRPLNGFNHVIKFLRNFVGPKVLHRLSRFRYSKLYQLAEN